MNQHTLHPSRGSKHSRKRLGRGNATGQGTYAGRGLKGQKARGSVRPGFEGGQIPLVRRAPRLRGFKNFSRLEFEAVNLNQLAENFAPDSNVNGDTLAAIGLVSKSDVLFKVLGRGEISFALSVEAPRLSQSAKDAITAAGGNFKELSPAVKRVRNRIHRRKLDTDVGESSPENGDDEN
ncbi:MAG: 50S ribosomal protein L15 [Chloroflexi bacterium]|nr:50S ribosomal protein L15 [Chloroflexota bacterium]|tara:strand:+ start:1653 stop:2189 length:537 start_codon:yes stop_codon:yes gene_type:complete